MFKIESVDVKKLLDKNIQLYVYLCGIKYKIVRIGNDKSMLGYIDKQGNVNKLHLTEHYEITL